MTPYHESDGVKETMNKWTRHKDENGYWRHVYRFPDESRVEIQRDPQGGLFPWRVVRYANDGAWCGMSPWSHFVKARNFAKFIIKARNAARLWLSGRGSGCCSDLDTGAEVKMGTSPHVDAKKFPQQGSLLGRKVNVCFHYYTQRQIGGVVVRDDITEPFIGIIRLDDGRHVLMTECQFQEQ